MSVQQDQQLPAREGQSPDPGTTKGTPSKNYPEDTDNRKLWDPRSKYDSKYIEAQRFESCYIFGVLALGVAGLVTVGVGGVDRFLVICGLHPSSLTVARQYEWLAVGGLLGGIVYSAKWLYHAVAKGLWHEDRRVWRYLSPWISVGTTLGIGALLIAGFFKPSMSTTPPSGSTYLGMGFLIGYFADMFLAKMKDVTQVLFGETESHFKRSRDKDNSN